MRDKKYQIARYAFYDKKAIEDYFEKMASKGWLIEKINSYFWQFRRIEPQNLNILITYSRNRSELSLGMINEQQSFRKIVRDGTWKLLTCWEQMQVFCGDTKDVNCIELDPVKQVETIWCAMKEKYIPVHLILLLITAFLTIFNIYEMVSDTVNFLSTPYLLVTFSIWLIVLLIEIDVVRKCFRWYRKSKLAAQNGIFVSIGTNYCIISVLILTGILVLISVLQLSGQIRIVSIVCLLVVLGIVLLGHIVRHHLRERGVSSSINNVVTILVTLLLTLILLTSVSFYIIHCGINNDRKPIGNYEKNGLTFDIYNDPMPLHLEDMMEIGDSQWSRERSIHKQTFLLSQAQYRQRYIQGGPEGLGDLEYTVVDIKLPILYDAVKQSMLNKRQDNEQGKHIFINHYEPVDVTIWNAVEAYQFKTRDGFLNIYLVCWENRIIEINFAWEPTTKEITVAVEKLKSDISKENK